MTSDYSLKRCGLKDQTIYLLESKKIRTAYDVLRLSTIDLVQLVGVSYARAKEIRESVSTRICHKIDRTTAMHMKEVEQKDPRSVKTGIRTLDDVLKGGLRAGTITELVGPPGSCKSQLCLQVALFATLPRHLGGLDGRVLYFDTKNHFCVDRLVQMAQSRFPDRYLTLPLLNKLLSQILVSNLFTLSELDSLLPNIERVVLEHNIRTIIIDDIAVLARTEYAASETIERQRVLGKIASHLKKVACAYRIPVLIVNQVMSVRDESTNLNRKIGSSMKLSPEMHHYNAALGAKWAHYVNTRLALQHTGLEGWLNVVKSPFAPETRIQFRANELGLEERVHAEVVHHQVSPQLDRIHRDLVEYL